MRKGEADLGDGRALARIDLPGARSVVEDDGTKLCKSCCVNMSLS